MVFKDAALTPEELPKTTPVPNPHGRLPTGVSLEPLGGPVGVATAARGSGLEVERHIVEEAGLTVDPLSEDLMVVNIGPSHPAMHGTFRLKCRLDGETIVKAVPRSGISTGASRRWPSSIRGRRSSPTRTGSTI